MERTYSLKLRWFKSSPWKNIWERQGARERQVYTLWIGSYVSPIGSLSVINEVLTISIIREETSAMWRWGWCWLSWEHVVSWEDVSPEMMKRSQMMSLDVTTNTTYISLSQSGPLQSSEIMMLLCQLSYATKKGSLWHKGAYNTRCFACMEATYMSCHNKTPKDTKCMPWGVLLWHRPCRQHSKVPPMRVQDLDGSWPMRVDHSGLSLHVYTGRP